MTDEAGIYAVIAPNMCKQIVAFQATMQHMAENFPGAFDGYTMEIKERFPRCSDVQLPNS